jgi:hypothetical protein
MFLSDELKQAAETLPQYGSPLREDRDCHVQQEYYALEYRHWHLVGAVRFGSSLVIDALHLTGEGGANYETCAADAIILPAARALRGIPSRAVRI